MSWKFTERKNDAHAAADRIQGRMSLPKIWYCRVRQEIRTPWGCRGISEPNMMLAHRRCRVIRDRRKR